MSALRGERSLQLRIGRPDLPRHFDDGGLIDVNTVPAQVLSQLPGLRPEDVERIVTARLDPLGLHSVEDLIVTADVSTDVAESLREVLVFSPSTPRSDHLQPTVGH